MDWAVRFDGWPVYSAIIAGNAKAMLAWDQAVRGEHGGNRNPSGINQHAPPKQPAEVKPDNILLDQKPQKSANSDYGTSTQAGLRRLEKAATAGDPNASAALRRVLDPKDKLTVNGACVALGWRKPTLTVTDTAGCCVGINNGGGRKLSRPSSRLGYQQFGKPAGVPV